ncbi:hypothetical protein PACTADRAFT_74117 [Pachysolen tannophilus NRRL Y-2460]|uniref:Uncharacterized protein n=1 Tax=Pachysolen tannophilus NRRL Y-2460 TaxID=669874 RepID=A0A1E4U3L5_PACTA|nr:hypothetical protein PACTADRAFT_74117 [Pachysolen tannophilus NRRL Y-2460]
MEEISVEETNRLRIQLGLNPIPTPINSNNNKNNNFLVNDKLNNDDEKNDLDDDDEWLSKLSSTKSGKVPENKSNDDKAENIKVGHSLKDVAKLKDGEVFTLKDKSILSDEDELISESLVEKKKVQDTLKAKLGRAKYSGFDDDQYEGENNGKDDEIEEGSFVLNGDIAEELNDYHTAKPIKIKKHKVNKKSVSRKRKLEADLDLDLDLKQEQEQEQEEKDKVPQKVLLNNEDEGDIVDDDELQALLSLQRKKAQKNNKNIQIKREKFSSFSKEATSPKKEEQEYGLVIDENSLFLDNIRAKMEEPVIVKTEPAQAQIPPTTSTSTPTTISPPTPSSLTLPEVKPETEYFGSGLASTLKLLKNTNEQDKKLSMNQRTFNQKRDLLRISRETTSSTNTNTNTNTTDPKLSKEQEDLLNHHYNPKINLKYYDDKGNILKTPKEVYKYMSHQFHGNGGAKSKK